MSTIRPEEIMNARLLADSIALRQTALRMQRAGLIVDRAALSPEHRRAFFALQCRDADFADQRDSPRPKIGFAYPNAR